jgi:hypothetical protein
VAPDEALQGAHVSAAERGVESPENAIDMVRFEMAHNRPQKADQADVRFLTGCL